MPDIIVNQRIEGQRTVSFGANPDPAGLFVTRPSMFSFGWVMAAMMLVRPLLSPRPGCRMSDVMSMQPVP
ncbi:MAG TPA: hypothetical protein VFO01_16090, partial [Trebonia sp.]|nr:hypothetical protein [Trebonia sp.]